MRYNQENEYERWAAKLEVPSAGFFLIQKNKAEPDHSANMSSGTKAQAQMLLHINIYKAARVLAKLNFASVRQMFQIRLFRPTKPPEDKV